MKLALGLGCDRGTPAATIAQVIAEALSQAGATLADVQVPPSALAGIVRDATTYRQLANTPRRLNAEDLKAIVTRALGV